MPKSQKSESKTLVLLDAHALLHRAYHALPEFTNSKGIPTGGLYGYTSMILKIIGLFHPDYVAACYDLPQKTFRHEAYDNYKGHRSKTDDALVAQINLSRELCGHFNIPIYDLPGFEADDMLGTIVAQTRDNKDLEIIIATGDMDSLQLVDKEKVRVFTLKKGINDTIVYNESLVQERFGFGPEFLADYKGLRGDPSDNIIGVPGIGDKTATELILKFGHLEALYEKLHADKQTFFDQGIKERMINLLLEHEESAIFSKTLATIRRDAPITFTLPENRWQETCSFDLIEPVLREYEFKSLIPRFKEALSHSNSSSSSPQASSQEGLSEELKTESIPTEISIAAWLLDSEKTQVDTADILHLTNTKTLPEAEKVLVDRIHDESMDFLYNDIELPLIPVLQSMHDRGVLIDRDFLKTYSGTLHKKLTSYEEQIYEMVGHTFNINSPKQLGEILFGEMQIHLGIKGFKVKKTASGTYSTRESDLEKLRDTHPIIELIFEYREIQKLLSTYIDNMPEMLDAENRLHPDLIQTGTTTGRFSSQNPNIQNIPIRGDQGKMIRNAFIAPEGFTLLAADYSQIELRCAAILSGDEVLLSAFTEGKDIHTSVASRVFHVDESEVTTDMRRKAKVINFGILYGMGVTSLQKNLGTNRAEAQQFYDEYFKQMQGLARYIEETTESAKKLGYTETLFGRRRYFPGLRSSIPFIKAMAERAASNAPIQGTSADIIKYAMVHIYKAINDHGWQDAVFMTMQVHDELVFEIRDDLVAEASEMIRTIMQSVLDHAPFSITHKVPLLVSLDTGKNWGEAKG